jgi:hypothetical protein
LSIHGSETGGQFHDVVVIVGFVVVGGTVVVIVVVEVVVVDVVVVLAEHPGISWTFKSFCQQK